MLDPDRAQLVTGDVQQVGLNRAGDGEPLGPQHLDQPVGRLGGSGTQPGSLFTQCLGVNRGVLRVFEGEVAGKVDAGETVYYAVALGYFGRVIPESVSAFYAGSRGSANAKTFSNVC